MRDNDLIRLFLPIIQQGLIDYGFTGVTTKQSNQPTLQGVNTNPTVYFFKVADHRYGFLYRKDDWDADASVMRHTESQQYETTFQVSALVLQNPKNPYGYTASDLVNTVAAIMQSDSTIETLENAGVGILRVIQVQNPYFMDDRDQFEASPSFDFVLTHKQTRVTTTPVIESYEFNINRV